MVRAVGAIVAAVAAVAALVAVYGIAAGPGGGGGGLLPDLGLDLLPDLGLALAPAVRQDAPYADVYTGNVTRIVDGDTLDVDRRRIRLVLVNTPERGDAGFSEATAFTRSACPVGSAAVYVVDSMQGEDRYGRIVAAVWCDGTGNSTINEALLDSGHAELYGSYCQRSSFGAEGWAVRHGC